MSVTKSPVPQSRWHVLIPRLAGGIALLYVISLFVPATPVVHHGEIEDSYIQFWHTAFVQHLQFGRDIAFTVGPWGFLYGGYLPATHAVSVIAWMVLSLVFWWTSLLVARYFSTNPLVSWLWLMCFTAAAGLEVFTLLDGRWGAFVVLLWLLYFFVENRPCTLAQCALVVALALFSLVKFTAFFETAMVLGLISADTIIRHRRFPWLLFIFAAGVFLFWIAGGQQAGGLGLYLQRSLQVTSGYTEGSMLSGPAPALGIFCFVVASAMLFAAVGYAARAQPAFARLIALAALGAILFTVFKHGYVRNDFHEAAAALELLLISLAVLAIVWPVALRRGRNLAIATLAPSVLIFLFAALTFGRYHEQGLPAHLLGTLKPRNVMAPVRLCFGTAHLREGFDHYLAAGRDSMPLPGISGTVDTYPGNCDALLSYKLRYHPRPVFQSLVAYTPQLAELNAAFLRSSNAPDSIVFQIIPVDDHFPTLDDGRSWLELLTRYDVKQVEWPWALLKKSPQARAWHLTPIADVQFRFGEVVPVPALTNGPIWAEFEIKKTLAGAIVSTLYKPPLLELSVSTSGGGMSRHRLVPAMAQSGFLLSPLIREHRAFATLAAGNAARELAGEQVTSLSVSAITKSGSTACYDSLMRLRLYRLEYPAQDLSGLESIRDLKSLSEASDRLTVLRADERLRQLYSPRYGSVLQVSANSAFQMPAPEHAKVLEVGFGVMGAMGGTQVGSNGVTFRISTVDREGKLAPLWSQRLNQSNGNDSSGRKQTLIDLGRLESPDLVFETIPDAARHDGVDHCYWSRIEFQRSGEK